MLLWPPISVGTTTSIVWAERLLATFTCAELLPSATTCMEWPFVASMLPLFVHAWSTVVQCGVVHHLPCRGCRESPASSGKSDRPEYDLAGHVNAPAGSSPHFVVAKARTLPWPSLAAFYWEGSSCITGLTGALCTATVYSLSSLLSFSFCFIVSSLVILSLSNCPHLEQAVFFCHLFYVFLSLPFDQQFDATLSLICSPMVSLSYFLSFLS